MQSVVDTLLQNQEATISAIIIIVSGLQWFLGPEHDVVERYRSVVFRKLNPIAKILGQPLVFVCRPDEYICSVEITPDELERAIHPVYRRNLTATKKALDANNKLIWSEGSWAHKDSPTAEKQHHCWFFDMGDRIDIYGHYEDAVVNPSEHLDASNQQLGDPNDTLKQTLEQNGVEYFQKD